MQAIDDAVLRHTSRLLSLSLPLVLVYLSNRKDESLVQKVWDAVLSAVADADSFAVTLSPLLDATERKALPPFLKPESDPLDRPAGQLMARSLAQGAVVEVSVIEKLLKYPGNAYVTTTKPMIFTSRLQTTLSLKTAIEA